MTIQHVLSVADAANVVVHFADASFEYRYPYFDVYDSGASVDALIDRRDT